MESWRETGSECVYVCVCARKIQRETKKRVGERVRCGQASERKMGRDKRREKGSDIQLRERHSIARATFPIHCRDKLRHNYT